MDADAVVEDALNQPDPGTEQFEQAVAAEFEAASVVAEEAPAAEEEVEEEQIAQDDAPPPAPEVPDFIEIGGVQVPNDKAQALAEFWNWSQSTDGQTWLHTLDRIQKEGLNPGQLLDAVVTKPPPPAVPETPEPAFSDDDFLDPATKRIYEDQQAMRDELERLRTQVATSQAQQGQAMIATASKRFSEDHGLSVEETQQIVDHLERTANLAGYAVDPITNIPRDGVSTLYAAMEAALWANPEFRQRELDRVAKETQERQRKDRKLAAVGGTSGSVPQKPQPASPAERDEWAVEQITEAMGLAK